MKKTLQIRHFLRAQFHTGLHFKAFWLAFAFVAMLGMQGWGQTTIVSGSTINASTIPVNNSITINAGGTLNMDVSRTFASIASVGTGTSAISGTGALTVTGAITIQNSNILSLNPISTSGSLVAGYNSETQATLSGSGILTTGTVTINGANGKDGYLTISINSTVICTSLVAGSGNKTFNITVNGVFKNSGATTSIDNFTCGASSTVEYNGAAQTVYATTYNNLTLSGSGAKTFPTGTTTVNGIFSIENGSNVNTYTGTLSYGTNATLQYNSASARNTGAEWVTPFVATGGVVVKNTGAITLSGAKQLGSNTNVPLNINNGATLTPGSNLLTFHGNFINAGTLSSGSGGVTIAGTVTTQSIAGFTTTGIVSMTKTAGAATFTGNVNGAGLTINGAGGTLNLGAGLVHTFSGNWARTAGTLNGGTSLLKIGGDVSGSGSTFNAGTGTVEWYADVAQSVAGVAYYNLTITGSGTKSLAAATTVSGNLYLTAGALVAGSNLSMLSISTIHRGAGSMTGIPQGTGLYNVIYTSSANTTASVLQGSGLNDVTIDPTSAGTVSLGTSPTLQGNFYVLSGTFAPTSYKVTIGGTFTFTGGTINVNQATFADNYSKNPTPAAGTTMNYNGTVAQVVSNAFSYANLTLSGSGAKTTPSTGTLSITGNLTLTGTTTASIDNAATVGGNLAIGSGSVLNVNPAKTLSVVGTTTLGSAQCFVLKSDATGTASFIDNGTISGAGTAKIERYLAKYDVVPDYKFHFLSSPVGAAQVIQPEFSNPPSVPLTDFYKWDEPGNTWVNYRGTDPTTVNASFGTNFIAGKGYLVAYPNDVIKNFAGTPYTNASGLLVPCTNTPSPGGQGWNLLGNPFPSAINWNTVTKSNVDNALYYYDNTTAAYVYYINLTGGTGSATQYIPAEQGFMVHANSATGSITMKNSDRVHQSLNTYYKNEEEVLTDNVLNIWVEGNGKRDDARVCFYSPATENFDGEYDAFKLFSYNASNPELYSVTPDNSLLAINTLPLSNMSGAVPVGFTPGTDGTFTFHAAGMENFESGVNIVLNDLKLNTTQDLKDNPVYTFTSSTNDDANRFQILFGVVGIGELPTAQTVSGYFANGNLYVTTNSDVTHVSIFNMQGQQLQNFQLFGKGQQSRALNLQTGVYIARLMNDGKMQTVKIIVK